MKIAAQTGVTGDAAARSFRCRRRANGAGVAIAHIQLDLDALVQREAGRNGRFGQQVGRLHLVQRLARGETVKGAARAAQIGEVAARWLGLDRPQRIGGQPGNQPLLDRQQGQGRGALRPHRAGCLPVQRFEPGRIEQAERQQRGRLAAQAVLPAGRCRQIGRTGQNRDGARRGRVRRVAPAFVPARRKAPRSRRAASPPRPSAPQARPAAVCAPATRAGRRARPHPPPLSPIIGEGEFPVSFTFPVLSSEASFGKRP